jgi:large subunit ribosomal protein L18
MAKNKSRNQARAKRHSRVRSRITGTSERPRLNVFRSLSDIYVQIIDDNTGHTLVAASSIDHKLRDEVAGMNKTEQAMKVGKAWLNVLVRKASRK